MVKRKINLNVECLDMNEDDDEGFIEGDVDLGKSIAFFSFGNNLLLQNNVVPAAPQNLFEDNTPSLDTMRQKSNTTSDGVVSSIDNESFSIKRGYQFKPSTIRKLHELKTLHPNVDVYLNVILDEAIQYFYNYIVNEKGSFKSSTI